MVIKFFTDNIVAYDVLSYKLFHVIIQKRLYNYRSKYFKRFYLISFVYKSIASTVYASQFMINQLSCRLCLLQCKLDVEFYLNLAYVINILTLRYDISNFFILCPLYISGCVTSAETVLIQEQSYDKLLSLLLKQNQHSTTEGIKDLEENNLVIVVALSPQSVASVGHYIGKDCGQTFLLLSALLKSLGVHYVLDATSTGDVALVAAGYEFLHRYYRYVHMWYI